MSKKPFSDKRWQHISWDGVSFDNSKVTPEQKKKTKEFHELFRKGSSIFEKFMDFECTVHGIL